MCTTRDLKETLNRISRQARPAPPGSLTQPCRGRGRGRRCASRRVDGGRATGRPCQLHVYMGRPLPGRQKFRRNSAALGAVGALYIAMHLNKSVDITDQQIRRDAREVKHQGRRTRAPDERSDALVGTGRSTPSTTLGHTIRNAPNVLCTCTTPFHFTSTLKKHVAARCTETHKEKRRDEY